MKPESFYSPFFELFSFCGRVCMRGKSKSGSEFFLGTGFRKFPTYHLLKRLIRWILLCIVHSFFLCFSFSYLQTSFYLIPSFTATVLQTSVHVAIPITPALSLLLKVLLQLFCFRLFQNVSFVFFSYFLIKQHPIPEIFTAHLFKIFFLCCLSFLFPGIKQRFLPRKFWHCKVYLLHSIILFLHVLLYNRLVFSHLFFAASFPSIIPFCPTLFRPFLP